jgi:hypothetical protein
MPNSHKVLVLVLKKEQKNKRFFLKKEAKTFFCQVGGAGLRVK